jgi:hypothetical protein
MDSCVIKPAPLLALQPGCLHCLGHHYHVDEDLELQGVATLGYLIIDGVILHLVLERLCALAKQEIVGEAPVSH